MSASTGREAHASGDALFNAALPVNAGRRIALAAAVRRLRRRTRHSALLATASLGSVTLRGRGASAAVTASVHHMRTAGNAVRPCCRGGAVGFDGADSFLLSSSVGGRRVANI